MVVPWLMGVARRAGGTRRTGVARRTGAARRAGVARRTGVARTGCAERVCSIRFLLTLVEKKTEFTNSN